MTFDPVIYEQAFNYSDGSGSEKEWSSLFFNEAFSASEVSKILLIRESVANVFKKYSIDRKLPVLSLLSSVFPLRLIKLLASYSTNNKPSVLMLGGGSAYLGFLCYLSGITFWGNESVKDSFLWQQELLSNLAPNQTTSDNACLEYSLNDFENDQRTGDIVIFASLLPLESEAQLRQCHLFLKSSNMGYLLIPRHLFVNDEGVNSLFQMMNVFHFECVESGDVFIFQPYEVSISCKKHKRLLSREEFYSEAVFIGKDFLLDVIENDHDGHGIVFDGKGFPREQ